MVFHLTDVDDVERLLLKSVKPALEGDKAEVLFVCKDILIQS